MRPFVFICLKALLGDLHVGHVENQNNEISIFWEKKLYFDECKRGFTLFLIINMAAVHTTNTAY